MKGYHLLKHKIQHLYEVEHPSFGNTENRLEAMAKLEDEKRVFDLRWQAACQIYASQFTNPNGELAFGAERAWDIAEDLLKAAGVIE